VEGPTADHNTVMVSEGDDCYIDLGGVAVAVKIVGFHGADVALMIDDTDPTVNARLRETSKAHLLLCADSGKRAQRGTVIYSGAGPMMIFRTSDDAYDGLKRTHSRAPLRLDVLVSPIAAEDFATAQMFRTTTLDVSAGGLRIPRDEHQALERCRLMLTLPDATKVSVLGRLNRAGAADLAYTFSLLSTGDRSRISRFVLSWHIDFLRSAQQRAVGAVEN
jgi:hypothetical protein